MKEIEHLVNLYGKEKINTLTKYPSILTLHQLGDRGVLNSELTTPIEGEKLVATEKIDGTNVRIICVGKEKEYIIGSREHLLHYSEDMFYDRSQDIVEGLKSLGVTDQPYLQTESITVFYGELYGGKIGANAKQYGTDKMGVRFFDVAEFNDLSMLDLDVPEISKWRETETAEGIKYGQKFLTREEIEKKFPMLPLVPQIEFELADLSHQGVLNSLKKYIATSNVVLSETALNRAEGVILRNVNRSKIVKVRFEDYERTLRHHAKMEKQK